MKYNTIVVRYDELGLKGNNRRFFEEKLAKNMYKAIKRNLNEIEPSFSIKILRGRIVVEADLIVPEMIEALRDVMGISSFSRAIRVPPDFSLILDASKKVLNDELQKEIYLKKEKITFRVEASRGNKGFPLNSMAINLAIADTVVPMHEKLSVKLIHPELSLGIDVRNEAYVFCERIEGLRGLPVGTGGKLLCLLSGGIDSPVAAFSMLRRGAWLDFINFHSAPYIGEESKGKVEALARILKKYQFRGKLFVVNFSPFQTEIKLHCQERFRTILYRRAMMAIASKVAQDTYAKALVTGESLGQVASQTIENMISIEARSSIPVLRPLIASDKQEVIQLSKKIGTYSTSILPYGDSCTVFAPKKPATKTDPETLRNEELKFAFEDLLMEAVSTKEVIHL